MTTNITPQSGNSRVQRRAMRYIIPIVMGAFLFLGVALALGIQINSRGTLQAEHRVALDEFERNATTRVDRVAATARQLAGSTSVRQFAQETLVSMMGPQLESLQQRLLANFVTTLQQNQTDYLALRYVTSTGSIWSEVTLGTFSMPQINTSAQMDALSDDPTVTEGLVARPGDVVASTLALLGDAEIAGSRLTPYLRFASPVSTETDVSNVVGLVQIDVLASPILDALEASSQTLASAQVGRRLIVLDEQGNVLVDSADPQRDFLRALAQGEAVTLSDQIPALSAVLADTTSTEVSAAGELLFSQRPIALGSAGLNWKALLIDQAALVQGGVENLTLLLVLGALAMGGAVSLAISAILSRSLGPISTVNAAAQQWLDQGKAVPDLSAVLASGDDEFGQLMLAFESMSKRVQDLNREMETKLGRYTRNLDIAARINRETSMLDDIGQLMQRSVNLICEEFGFHHAQVFMVDDAGVNAALVHSYGETGQNLLQQNLRLPVTAESSVGTVVRHGTPVVLNDGEKLAADALYQPLVTEETRSALLLPLQSGDRVVGVLDIQSSRDAHFQDDDVRVFQLLADQIGAALFHTRRLLDSRSRLEQAESLNRQLTRGVYEDVGPREQIEGAYRYDLLNVEQGDAADLPAGALELPINIRGQVIGSLAAAAPEGQTFTDEDHAIMQAVAERVAIAIENARLFEETQFSLAETFSLYQASRALSDAGTPAEIIETLRAHLIEQPADLVMIGLLNSDRWDRAEAALQIAAAWQSEAFGVDLTGTSIEPHETGAWPVLASTDVRMFDDLQTAEGLTPEEMKGLSDFGVRAVSIIPLRAGRRAIGAILIGSRAPYEHSERDLRTYRSFGEQASLRIEASRLLAQTERRARQLSTSAEVSQIASSILDLEFLLPRLVDVIRDAFGYDHAQIFLMDEDDDYAVLRASTGEAGAKLLSINHKLQKGSASVIGQVTATAKPVIASDTEDARFVHRPNPLLPTTRSEMALPLVVKGRVVGALDVQSNRPNAFDDDDVTVLTTLAAQISVAIDNAELFQQSRSRASEMSFLFSMTTVAASAQTLNEALQNIADELRDSLDALSASVYLPQTFIDKDETMIVVMQPVAVAGGEQPISELAEVRLDAYNNVIASAANTRRPVIIADVAEEPNYLPVIDDARSAVVVPLASGGQLTGLITLESAEEDAFADETLTLLLTLSGTLSAIIQSQQLLEQLQKTNEQLRELDRLKSDFLANMSHELRTPLNSIIGFSRVILKGIDGPLTEMQEQDLTTIYNSGQHLLKLINDILDQAKIAAGKMDLQFDYFEMKEVIDGVRSIGIGLVKDKPIDIVIDLASGLPKAYGDEFRTRQVLINLVSNAAKFTREGSISISVVPVKDEESGLDMLRVDVTDTGIGIDEQDLPLLFEAFRQVDSSLTRTQGGTGLGLPIAKSLIEMQGGRMEVASQANVGSTFSVFVPTQPASQPERKKITDKLPELGDDDEDGRSNGHADAAAVAEPATVVSGTPVDTLNMRQPMHIKRQILLIEDDPAMVDQFRRILQREGFDIYSASIPLEAEAMASGLRPTLIIMDVNFAEGQGWDMLARLKDRDDTADIPVIVVTLSNEEARAQELGVFRFIQRPFMPEAISRAVEEAEQESRVDRILIIDDQPDSVRLIEQMLTLPGRYKVFSAHSGMDGIAMVARRRPNLVIVDLRMPEMDGFEVIREMRSNPETANIPILVVTNDELTPEEAVRLDDLEVHYKAQIASEQQQIFLDGIKTRLARAHGER